MTLIAHAVDLTIHLQRPLMGLGSFVAPNATCVGKVMIHSHSSVSIFKIFRVVLIILNLKVLRCPFAGLVRLSVERRSSLYRSRIIF